MSLVPVDDDVVDTCTNINGAYVSADHTCHYDEYRCPYHDVAGQCHRSVLCDTFSCDTCLLYGGLHEPTSRW